MELGIIPADNNLYAIKFTTKSREVPTELFIVTGAYSRNSTEPKPFGKKLGDITDIRPLKGEYTPLQVADIFGKSFYLVEDTEKQPVYLISGALALLQAENSPEHKDGSREQYIDHLHQIGAALRAKNWGVTVNLKH